MKIEVHVPVSAQSLPYYRYMLQNYLDTSAHAERLIFHAHAMDPNLPIERVGASAMGAHIHEAGVGRGSGGHAVAFQNAVNFPRLDDTYIRIVADTDTVMLMKGWDDKLLSLLFPLAPDGTLGATFDVIGTTYEPIGGFSSGDGPVQTYKGRPNATWIAFGMPSIGCFMGRQFGPAKQEHLAITDSEMSARYNLPIGNQLLRDVGWQIPEIIDRNHLRDMGLAHVKPTMGARAILTSNDYHEEYQLPDGTPFVGHQRGSMKHPFRGTPISSAFYNAVEAYLNDH